MIRTCLRAVQSFYGVQRRLQVGAVFSVINELFYAVEEGRGIKGEEMSRKKGVCGGWGAAGLCGGHLSCHFYCHP